MNSSAIPLEFELALTAIAAQAYPHIRYSLTFKIERYQAAIEFNGFFTEQFAPNHRPYPNPTDEYYRCRNVDFSLMYVPKRGHLILSGWWRGALLALHYHPNKQLWLNEDGDEINTPYPDGDRFESLASSLLPVCRNYFQPTPS